MRAATACGLLPTRQRLYSGEADTIMFAHLAFTTAVSPWWISDGGPSFGSTCCSSAGSKLTDGISTREMTPVLNGCGAGETRQSAISVAPIAPGHVLTQCAANPPDRVIARRKLSLAFSWNLLFNYVHQICSLSPNTPPSPAADRPRGRTERVIKRGTSIQNCLINGDLDIIWNLRKRGGPVQP